MCSPSIGARWRMLPGVLLSLIGTPAILTGTAEPGCSTGDGDVAIARAEHAERAKQRVAVALWRGNRAGVGGLVDDALAHGQHRVGHGHVDKLAFAGDALGHLAGEELHHRGFGVGAHAFVDLLAHTA